MKTDENLEVMFEQDLRSDFEREMLVCLEKINDSLKRIADDGENILYALESISKSSIWGR